MGVESVGCGEGVEGELKSVCVRFGGFIDKHGGG